MSGFSRTDPDYDVAVIGGGNAALCAAISARRAGAHAILVPNSVTRREAIVAAPVVVADLESAVALVLGDRRPRVAA